MTFSILLSPNHVVRMGESDSPPILLFDCQWIVHGV